MTATPNHALVTHPGMRETENKSRQHALLTAFLMNWPGPNPPELPACTAGFPEQSEVSAGWPTVQSEC